MSDNNYEENGQFTDAYKFQLLTHPVLLNLTDIIIKAMKSEERPDIERTFNRFFDNIDLSAQEFYNLEGEAYEEVQKVHDGIHLLNCMLHQLYPELEKRHPMDHTYLMMNKLFWGRYFYKNGVDGSNNAPESSGITAWHAAKVFAAEHWRFGEEHFPETIGWGYQWLLENEPKEKLEFQKIPELLRRYEYEDDSILGFCYFLGLCAQAGKTGEKEPEIFERLKRLPDVDINGEYEALLGPLRTAIMDNTFDELVWRFNGEFESRKIELEQPHKPIYVYNFKNNGMIFDDDRKVQILKDAEDIFTRAMTVMGEDLQSNDYTFVQAFKAGRCSANLRAQSDQMTTYLAGSMFDDYLPLIFSAANRFTIDRQLNWSEHLDIQVPLQRFIGGLKYELGSTIWSYQSYVFFKDGAVRNGISDLSVDEFMAHCRTCALEFYSTRPDICVEVARERNHWSGFPEFSNDYDERELMLEVIEKRLGYGANEERKRDALTLKALIIFAYFCSLCETVLATVDGQKIH